MCIFPLLFVVLTPIVSEWNRLFLQWGKAFTYTATLLHTRCSSSQTCSPRQYYEHVWQLNVCHETTWNSMFSSVCNRDLTSISTCHTCLLQLQQAILDNSDVSSTSGSTPQLWTELHNYRFATSGESLVSKLITNTLVEGGWDVRGGARLIKD